MISIFAILTLSLIAPALSFKEVSRQVALGYNQARYPIRSMNVMNLGSGENEFEVRTMHEINGEIQWLCANSDNYLYFGPKDEATPVTMQQHGYDSHDATARPNSKPGFYKMKINGLFVSYKAGCGNVGFGGSWDSSVATIFALMPNGTLKNVGPYGPEGRQWYDVQAYGDWGGPNADKKGVYFKGLGYDHLRQDTWQPTKLIFEPIYDDESDPLPAGWEEYEDDEGEIWYGHTDGWEQGERPTAEDAADHALRAERELSAVRAERVRAERELSAVRGERAERAERERLREMERTEAERAERLRAARERGAKLGAERVRVRREAQEAERVRLRREAQEAERVRLLQVAAEAAEAKRVTASKSKAQDQDSDSDSADSTFFGSTDKYGKPINSDGDSNSARGYSTFFGTVLAIAVTLM